MREFIEKLQQIVGVENVKTDPDELERYSKDETSEIEHQTPLCVVFPTTAEEVSQIMKLANLYKVPVTPRGAGTGLSGGAVPIKGGIVLSLEKMNRIVEIDRENMVAVVEPGVITDEIQKLAEEYGLFYAGDPASSESSSIGGNVAENAGGVKVMKYGPTSHHILGLEVVLPTGEIVNFGGKVLKNVMGYDMVRLFVGSEGTLGIVTKIIVRLIPKPKYFATLLVPFDNVERAVLSVPKILSESGILPTSIELMDKQSALMASTFLSENIPHQDAECHLIIEVDGTDKDGLARTYINLGEKLQQMGALEVYIADNRYQRLKIWKFRKAIAEGIIAFRPRHCMEDVSVPIKEIPKLIMKTYEIAEENKLEVLNFGHVGDGNVHVTFLKPEQMSEQLWKENLEKALVDLYQTTAKLGGTITGEHGIGIKRKKYLSIFMSKNELDLMKKLKRIFDPNNVLNPGKVFD
ncbi:FAD-binding oxidoreductase [Pseudothermotoga thermarum]|uniref:FAD linked oxidase domain protein n=1 Tax=Pseudothermotoga thermarum DSM 5069 TaxID=688269 RepID=F7YVE1_9THEM|nr:FAD-binding oxidoreductase [Pseudothermotoga thermarum]AEH50444.1 FAD linked oxidase domain protein [Pseudothermotoga thermarum DSM 5069]